VVPGTTAVLWELHLWNQQPIARIYGRGYLDRYMVVTQLEYRLVLPKRFGLVGFGGIGESRSRRGSAV